MAIFRCKSCDYLREVQNQHIGKNATCPSCKASTAVQDTLMALSNMLAEVKNTRQQNQQLQQQVAQFQAQIEKLAQEKQQIESQLRASPRKSNDKAQAGYAFANQDAAPELQNTEGVVKWLKNRQIRADVDAKAIDISGFFDEISVLLGDNYDTLKPLLDKINWSGRKGYDNASMKLPEKQEQAEIIKKFCRELYECGFVKKNIYTKENKILLSLQQEHRITGFFNGDWLEWYAFMKVATLLLKKNIKFSSLRSFEIFLVNNEKRELDLFFVIEDNKPLWIECKSGEFRDSIEKYSKLRKSLGVSKEYAILLVTDLAEDKAKGFTSMFDITVLTEKSFLPYISGLLANGTTGSVT